MKLALETLEKGYAAILNSRLPQIRIAVPALVPMRKAIEANGRSHRGHEELLLQFREDLDAFIPQRRRCVTQCFARIEIVEQQ